MRKRIQKQRIIALFLVIVMILTLTTACKASKNDPKSDNTGNGTIDQPVGNEAENNSTGGNGTTSDQNAGSETGDDPNGDPAPSGNTTADDPKNGEKTPGSSAEADPDKSGSSSKTVEELIAENHSVTPEVEINGEWYGRKKGVSAYLLMGIDKTGEAGQKEITEDNGRNDLNLVVVVDDEAKTYTTLQLNRDMMVSIDAVTYYGEYMDTFTMQLCLAYFYGNGADVSCRNAVNAVSRILGGVPIDGYAAINYDAVPYVNDAVGGVSVKIEDDFSKADPTLVMGETVLLKGEHATNFVRGRMNVGDGTNISRERRQRVYLNAFAETFRSQLRGSSGTINAVYNAAKPYMVTDMSFGTISNLAAKSIQYANKGILAVSGTPEVVKEADGVYRTEYFTDQEALGAQIRELFFTKVE